MISLTSEQLTAPCNYRVLDSRSRVLYVGCGAGGMGRVFDFTPEQKRRLKAFDCCDKVEIEFFSSKEAALKAEGDLIHQLHPKFNAFCPRCPHYAKRGPKRLQGRGLLFGKTRHAILSLLFEHPEKAFFTREVVRSTGLGTGCVQRELRNLAKICVLRREQIAGRPFYRAEIQSPFYNEMRSMVLKGA